MREKQKPGAERRDDAALLELLKTDPEEGMNVIIRRYSGLVASVIRQRLSCCGCVSTDIEDCAADTFSDFYIFRERYDPSRCGLPSWLASIARHKAADFADKNRCKGVNDGLDDPDATIGSVPEGASLLFPAGSEPADGSDDAGLRERLLREVKALGEPESFERRHPRQPGGREAPGIFRRRKIKSGFSVKNDRFSLFSRIGK